MNVTVRRDCSGALDHCQQIIVTRYYVKVVYWAPSTTSPLRRLGRREQAVGGPHIRWLK